MQLHQNELAASDLTALSLDVGDLALDFKLSNAFGNLVRLGCLLKQGPVVVSFYRGEWCPYCNLELQALQQVLPDIYQRDAQLVAISPQVTDKSLSTLEKNSLAFEVLSDFNNIVARHFGLVFQLPQDLQDVYQGLGIDLKISNGDDRFELPVPATFVIDPQSVIRYAFVNIDYRQRAEPDEILEVLDKIKAESSVAIKELKALIENS